MTLAITDHSLQCYTFHFWECLVRRGFVQFTRLPLISKNMKSKNFPHTLRPPPSQCTSHTLFTNLQPVPLPFTNVCPDFVSICIGTCTCIKTNNKLTWSDKLLHVLYMYVAMWNMHVQCTCTSYVFRHLAINSTNQQVTCQCWGQWPYMCTRVNIHVHNVHQTVCIYGAECCV